MRVFGWPGRGEHLAMVVRPAIVTRKPERRARMDPTVSRQAWYGMLPLGLELDSY